VVQGRVEVEHHVRHVNRRFLRYAPALRILLTPADMAVNVINAFDHYAVAFVEDLEHAGDRAFFLFADRASIHLAGAGYRLRQYNLIIFSNAHDAVPSRA
jgi:hypothetical protein